MNDGQSKSIKYCLAQIMCNVAIQKLNISCIIVSEIRSINRSTPFYNEIVVNQRKKSKASRSETSLATG